MTPHIRLQAARAGIALKHIIPLRCSVTCLLPISYLLCYLLCYLYENDFFFILGRFRRLMLGIGLFIVVLITFAKTIKTKLFYNFVHHRENSEKGGTFLGVYRQESRSFLP